MIQTSQSQYENAQGHSVDHPSIAIKQPPGGRSQISFGDSGDAGPSQPRVGKCSCSHQQKEVTCKPNEHQFPVNTPAQPSAENPQPPSNQQEGSYTRIGRGGVKGMKECYI
jgi:hypothetical protein